MRVRKSIIGKGSGSRRGFVLLSVLWAVIVISALAAGIGTATRQSARMAVSATSILKAELAAESALWTAAHSVLFAPSSESRADQSNAFTFPDAALASWLVSDHAVRARVTNEEIRIDLNYDDLGALAQAFRLGGYAERANEFAKLIVRYREEAIGARQTVSDEQLRRAGLVAFRLVEEVSSVAGLDFGVYQRLNPFVTVHGAAATIDSESRFDRLRAYGEQPSSALSQDPFVFLSPEPQQIVSNASLFDTDSDLGRTPTTIRVEAEALSVNGTHASYEAIITRRGPSTYLPYKVLSWKRSERRLFPSSGY